MTWWPNSTGSDEERFEDYPFSNPPISTGVTTASLPTLSTDEFPQDLINHLEPSFTTSDFVYQDQLLGELNGDSMGFFNPYGSNAGNTINYSELSS